MGSGNEANTYPTEHSVVGPVDDAIIPLEQQIVTDYSNVFVNHTYFSSRDDLFDWVRTTGRENGLVIVITRSDSGTANRGPRLTLGCERGGQPRQKKGDDSNKVTKNSKRERGSKKCGCPFRLKGIQLCEGAWELQVECGLHNHAEAPHMHGHSFVGRLSEPEKAYVLDMSHANSRPKDILQGLHEKFQSNKSSIRTIYNARSKNKIIERDGRSQMQQLVAKLIEHGYYYHHRRCEKTNTVQDLFLAHPMSVELLRSFPKVLFMDCTYKTNRYKLPLLEIVGVTSTNMTFLVGAAYMGSESQDNYIWALGILKALMNQSSLPTVIVTDRDLALMNAIEVTFPTSQHLLCRWHINKNILANCKKYFRTKVQWDQFTICWNFLVDAKNEHIYEEYLKRFQMDFIDYPAAVEYAMKQWIRPYKERFVSVWTNNVMHFDNNTTSRVESQHAALKRQLKSSQGDFETCWRQLHTLIETSHIAIKVSFTKSLTVVLPKYKSVIFQQLRGLVSTHALSLIYNEMTNIPEDGYIDPLLCGCVLRKTCGLPCRHEIAEYIRNDCPIPLDQVDSFWRKLDMLPTPENVEVSVKLDMDNRFNSTYDEIREYYENAPETEKLLIIKRMMEVKDARTNSLIVPQDEVRTRGRPKPAKVKKDKSTKRDPSLFEHVESMIDSCSPCDQGLLYEVGPSQQPPTFTTVAQLNEKIPVVRPRTRAGKASGNYVQQFPKEFRPFILGTANIIGDGHCGFRAVAGFMYRNEESWSRVRADLSMELMSNQELYTRILIERNRVPKVNASLQYNDISAPKAYWFDANDMGHLVASYYNIAFMVLDRKHCFTYLPLRTAPPNDPHIICIGRVNGDHFIQVFLREGYPLAPVPWVWDQNCSSAANAWKLLYINRQLSYSESVGSARVVGSSSDSIHLE